MGMPFSDATGQTGLYELFQDLAHTSPTDYPIAKFARDANNAYAEFMIKAIMASQKWQADDTNQTDYPIITLNLVSGQQDYPFTTDGSTIPNQILEITRVELETSAGTWQVLSVYSEDDTSRSITQLATASGTPNRYALRSNAIWLEFPTNYSKTGALKVYFGRTPVYFLATDTTKQAGIPDMYHRYLAFYPAYWYAIANLPSLAAGYWNEIQKIEAAMAQYYFFRNKNTRKNMRPMYHNTK